jgi:hypothetical protein
MSLAGFGHVRSMFGGGGAHHRRSRGQVGSEALSRLDCAAMQAHANGHHRRSLHIAAMIACSSKEIMRL